MSMAGIDGAQTFPREDSLCERCGYPLRGLMRDTDCPECGLGVDASSPMRRDLNLETNRVGFFGYLRVVGLFLLHPRSSFRRLSVVGDNLPAEQFVFLTCFLSALLLSAVWLLVSEVAARPGVRPAALSELLGVFVVSAIVIRLLVQVEVLGATAISRRRGWRVPYRLAERVCCYASVGWLPGVLVFGGAFGLLRLVAAGEPWFEQYLGLVKVAWVCYGGLFLVSLLWFETLVWVGVRQVKFANGALKER